ncbi:MAG: DNA mismatch repair endonuclease MutL [Chloroflexi bacterium]|nr:DNA mismatch repair endonuclease MutL [Chloroflexota bacterium]
MPIQILPPDLAAKIAAGEVIERPASVVKELVENAIDAEATSIRIATSQGGRRTISVADNGSGIPADQVPTAFARHATSKLASVEDLYRVRTLGFRGEALASIASVSRMALSTRAGDEPVGTSILFEGGEMVRVGPVARNRGTEVTVENLFYNTPARLKFLRTDTTESGHVARLISSYSLAFPERRFELYSNDRLVSKTTGTGQMRDVVLALYGLDVAEQMLDVPENTYQRDGVAVWGMIGSPSLHRANRRDVIFFVNHRWIQDTALAYAVTQAYHTLLPQGRHPLVILNISLPPEEVDVNIHPTKQEVRFREQGAVFAAVQWAVRSTLMSQRPVPAAELPGRSSASWTRPHGHGEAPLYPGQAQMALDVQRTGDLPASQQTAAPLFVVQPRPTERLPMLRIVGQIAQTYIIAEGPGGLYLIDQHAAHERIRYEALQEERAANQVPTQQLLTPPILELSPQQSTLLQDHLEALTAFGFDVTLFGHNAFLVKAVPVGLPSDLIPVAISEVLDAATEGGADFSWADQALMTVACHTAVRAGQTLSPVEMRDLVQQLEHTSLPHTCPHGRPTMIHVSQAQLERYFSRT